MSDAPVADARPGHNKPPVSPPFETDLLQDLKERYPLVEPKFDELMAAAKTVPETIQNDEEAGKVQELVRSMTNSIKRWKADRSLEKGPWQNLADTAFNFFKSREDKLDPVMKAVKAKHTDYVERKAAIEEKARQERAEAERKKADEALRAAQKAEADKLAAEKAKADAEEAERLALERAAKAKAEEAAAKERAAKAAEEERQALERQKEREAAAAAQRKVDLKELKKLNKEADALAVKDQAETITDDERGRYRELIGQGGLIPNLQAKLAGDRSSLSEEERAELDAEDANLKRLRDERVANHAAAEKAKAEKLAAQRQAQRASQDANEASADVKEAAKVEAASAKVAEKADSRAGRAERAVETATDADLSRTRSAHGTVGSLSGRWDYVVEDRAALTAYFGPLGSFLMAEAQDAAVYRYMRLKQGEFTETPARTEVPGVFFENVPVSVIR